MYIIDFSYDSELDAPSAEEEVVHYDPFENIGLTESELKRRKQLALEKDESYKPEFVNQYTFFQQANFELEQISQKDKHDSEVKTQPLH